MAVEGFKGEFMAVSWRMRMRIFRVSYGFRGVFNRRKRFLRSFANDRLRYEDRCWFVRKIL